MHGKKIDTENLEIEKISFRAARPVANDFYHTSSTSNMIHQLGWQELETHI